MGGITITSRDQEVQRQLQLLAVFCGVDVDFKTKESADPPELSIDDKHVKGFNTVCQGIASQTEKGKALLGSTPDTGAQIAEFLTSCHTQLKPITDAALDQVNSWLLSRTFLVDNKLSLADFVVFLTVYPALATVPAAQTKHYSSLLRWADYLQHTVDTTGLYGPLQFEMTPYRPAPPAPAPVPKEKVADNKTAAKAESTSTSPAPPPTPKEAAPQAKPTTDSSTAPQTSAANEKGTKKAKAEKAPKEDKGAKGAAKGAAGKTAEVTVDMLDMRVGKIVKVGRHPNADSLYVEEIDLGEAAPRQVISGLVKFVPIEAMENREVIVVTNLKPAKMKDVMSYGMVLCASNAEHTQVEPLKPPAGVPVGEKITFEGYDGEPEPVLNPKKKIWEQVAESLATDADGIAKYKDVPFMTSKGPLQPSLPSAKVA